MSLKGVKVLTLLTNIRLCWRFLPGTNTILFGFVKAEAALPAAVAFLFRLRRRQQVGDLRRGRSKDAEASQPRPHDDGGKVNEEETQKQSRCSGQHLK